MRGSYMLQKEVAEGEYIILNFIIGYFSCFTLTKLLPERPDEAGTPVQKSI